MRLHGIVLAGSSHWSASGLEALAPRPLLPVAHSALITYALRWLRDRGLAKAPVYTNSASRGVRAYLGDGGWLRLPRPDAAGAPPAAYATRGAHRPAPGRAPPPAPDLVAGTYSGGVVYFKRG